MSVRTVAGDGLPPGILTASEQFLKPSRGIKTDPEREDALIAAAADKAEARALKKDLAVVQAALRRVAAAQKKLRADERTLLKKPAGKRKQALKLVRAGAAKLRQQHQALIESETHVLARLAEIGETAARLRAEIQTEGLLDEIEGIGDVISVAGRDDSLQDKQTAKAATAQAAAEGITNPQMIEAFSERAVLDRRKQEIDGLAGQVKALYDKVVAEQARLRKNWAIQYRNLQRTPRKKRVQRQNYRDAIARINAALEILDGQEIGLLEQYHDLRAQSTELGFDIGELNAQITGMPRLDPALAVDAPTEADYIDAEIAEAGLTETLDDDLAAAEKAEAAAERTYNAAKQSGDPRQIRDAANALVAARSRTSSIKEAIKDLTKATKEQTEEERRAKQERVPPCAAPTRRRVIRSMFSTGTSTRMAGSPRMPTGGVVNLNVNTLLPSRPRHVTRSASDVDRDGNSGGEAPRLLSWGSDAALPNPTGGDSTWYRRGRHWTPWVRDAGPDWVTRMEQQFSGPRGTQGHPPVDGHAEQSHGPPPVQAQRHSQ